MEEEKHDLDAVLKRVIGTRSVPEEDAKLLLATGLLYENARLWQGLWANKNDDETKDNVPLYIVAPLSFHNAMKRISQDGDDFFNRASNSLGANDTPPLEDVPRAKLEKYHRKQGLSAAEFEKRIKPLLEKQA